MASCKTGVGRFTARSIAAVLRALPETEGSYQEVVRQASEYGVAISQSTFSKWVTNGRAGKRHTRYARFAQQYDRLRRCGPTWAWKPSASGRIWTSPVPRPSCWVSFPGPPWPPTLCKNGTP